MSKLTSLICFLGLSIAVCIARQQPYNWGWCVCSDTDNGTQKVPFENSSPPDRSHLIPGDGEYGDVIAIEIGSTYSRVGIVSNDTFHLIPNDEGEMETPSCIAFTDHGTLIGNAAFENGAVDPQNTICDIRQLLGLDLRDPKVQKEFKSVPYQIDLKHGKTAVHVKMGESQKLLLSEEILAIFITKLKNDAEDYLNRRVLHAVLTAPQYYTDTQRQALKDASTIAGLNALRIINEPTAASIGHDLQTRDEKVILVYDLNPTNTDVTLIDVDYQVFEILSSVKQPHLGVIELEDALFNHVSNIYTKQTRKLLTRRMINLIDSAIHKAETTLQTRMSTTIRIPTFPIADDFTETITRTQIQELQHQILTENFLPLIDDAISKVPYNAVTQRSEIDYIILTGSLSHTSLVLPFFESVFPKEKIRTSVPSNEAVIRGAAEQAHVLSTYEADYCGHMLDISRLSLGIETADGSARRIIPRHTIIPTRKTLIVTTVADMQRKVALKVFEGERRIAGVNKGLGTLEIEIAPSTKGRPRIEVVFEIDPNQNLMVIAKEVGEYRDWRLVIPLSNYWGVNLDNMILNAEEYSEEGEEVMKLARARDTGEYDDPFGVVVPSKIEKEEFCLNDSGSCALLKPSS